MMEDYFQPDPDECKHLMDRCMRELRMVHHHSGMKPPQWYGATTDDMDYTCDGVDVGGFILAEACSRQATAYRQERLAHPGQLDSVYGAIIHTESDDGRIRREPLVSVSVWDFVDPDEDDGGDIRFPPGPHHV